MIRTVSPSYYALLVQGLGQIRAVLSRSKFSTCQLREILNVSVLDEALLRIQEVSVVTCQNTGLELLKNIQNLSAGGQYGLS